MARLRRSLPSLAMTRYAGQLDAFAAAREAGDLHLTTLEELERDPGRVLTEIYGFLDLDPPGEIRPARENAAEGRTVVGESWKRLARQRALMAAGKRLLSAPVRRRIRSGSGMHRRSRDVSP